MEFESIKNLLRENLFSQNSIAHKAVVLVGFTLFYIFFFSSVLFSKRFLAPGDGLVYFMPAFYSIKTLWTDLLFGGYPIAADPQNMTWYPPALILSLIPNTWNLFVLTAYILAGSFSYFYVYVMTRSKLGAAVTGITYSMSGFMMAHLGHAAMIHAAAWIPLILVSLEKLRHQLCGKWLVIGGFATACCLLGGHPQISVYGLGTGFFYALFLGWSAPVGRWRYYRWSLGCTTLGISLCALQIIPTIELSRLSLRADLSFDAFLHYSLPAWQFLQLVFPYFFGGVLPPYTIYPQWGDWGLTETTGYVGTITILLTVLGALTYQNRSAAKFWFWFGLITLLAAFGKDFLVGQALYFVPIYNKFRAQGRHFVEVALAVSILAGMGVSSIQSKAVSKRLVLKTILISIGFMLVGLYSMSTMHSYFLAKAGEVGIDQVPILPWRNPTVGIPLVIFIVGILVLLTFHRYTTSRTSGLLLLALIFIDLSSFGWFYEWRTNAPAVDRLTPSTVVERYRDILQDGHERFLTSDGAFTVESDGLVPNLTLLWDLPNASGYSPLTMTRINQMIHVDQGGSVSSLPISSNQHELDLMAVKYLLNQSSSMSVRNGLAWSKTDLNLQLGTGVCAPSQRDISPALDIPVSSYKATTIAIVSQLSCSVEIPNNAELLEVQVVDTDGAIETHSLLTGRDTSEFAYDCPDVQPFMQHQRATVFKSTPTTRPNGEVCQAHAYVGKIQLNRPQEIRRIEFDWEGLPAVINIGHVSLTNASEATSLPITLLGTSPKWKKMEALEGGIVYENQDVLPRAWLVPETLALQPGEILTAIHTSQLPDGKIFDPKVMALVEDSTATLQSSALEPTDYTNVLNITETQVELETQTTAPAFLVLSDIFYPGWKATIDGQVTRIFQTNYIQRGVNLPPGKHIVRFEFYPLSFRIGLGITVASCFACMYVLSRRA
ncbi:YfhO family protein [Nodosilinea sp. LEGE 06152]|uniref:YfhO family protein n=1 Tax=Nodosilinea sp. LEGE 06152 TaxID=2777966 RepID=UPI00187FFA84|nr:YfhO family protein [Nodosilinea sp. LEGE 06152]MBE9156524.1 YfhO family protein [Nodosilinea sp. LEGE 06152]